MLIVFGAAKLLAETFERLRQPGIVVGEMLVGILIGPSALGWVHSNEVLTALAELGLIFLFPVGIEIRSSELLRLGATAGIVAILGVVAPLPLGYSIMRMRGAPSIESVFVGAVMVATSVGITAQALSARAGSITGPAKSFLPQR